MSTLLGFQLIDSITDSTIAIINNGDVFQSESLPDLKNLTIAATVPPNSPLFGQVESAFINLNSGEVKRTENGEPYSLFGDRNGNFFTGRGLTIGDSSVSFALFSEDRRQGDLLDTVTLNFSIVEDTPAPTNLVVDTLVDELDGSVTDGDISLRDAIEHIEAGGTITFDDNLAGGKINLSLGELKIEKSLTINGDTDNDSQADITLDGKRQSRVINVSDGTENSDKVVNLNGLNIRRGATDEGGGGILNFENLTVTNSTVSGNEAIGNGGGISNYDGILSIANTTIRGNRSESPGGGIYSDTSSFRRQLTLTDSTVSNNEARVGGGIANSGTASIVGSTIRNNKAINGGGVANIGNLSISDSIVRNNTSTENGSGIFNSGSGSTVTNSTIIGNKAGEDGGGIYSRAGDILITGSTISGNEAGDHGGGIFSYENNTTVISTIIRNASASVGGGIYNNGSDPNNELTVTGSTISGNSATNGGGIGNIGNAIVTGTTISSNFADDEGGGLFNTGGGSATISNSILADNFSSDNGGGISNYALVTITDSTINNNLAAGDGGGISSQRYSTTAISGSTISGNLTRGNGGGIFNYDGKTSIDNSTISRNESYLVGGGIYNSGSSPNNELSVTDSIISSNKADSGGGIGNIGEASITNTTIVKNEANRDGGGLFNTGGGSATISDSAVTKNTANRNGGGIFSVDAQFSLSSTTVKDNLPDNLFPELDVGLYDAASDSLIGFINEGDEILASTIPDLNNLTISITVPSSSPLFNSIESMRLDLNDGQIVKRENLDPYSLFGDRNNGTDLLGGSIPLGTNRIDIDVFAGNNLQGDRLGNFSRNFVIVNDL